jgi:hypothetical protein
MVLNMMKFHPVNVMICQFVMKASPTLSKPGVFTAVLFSDTWDESNVGVGVQHSQ